MAGSLNQVQLIGNLGRDPEVRSTAAGAKVVTFSIATSETWTDKASGDRRERTEWHNIVLFNEGLGKVAEQYLKKGAKVFVSGQMRTRTYTDKDGAERKATEVVLAQYRGELVLLDRIERQAPAEEAYGQVKGRTGGGAERTPERPASLSEVIDDDIPF